MQDKLFRKGLVVGIIFLFIRVGIYPAIAVESKQSYDYDIGSFIICFISGTNKAKTSNDEYQLILNNGEGNDTMKVLGIARCIYGEVVLIEWLNIHVWKIKAERFIGISVNGFVFGIGLEVYVEPNYIPN
jgi:hypothetical protein